jgi:cytochrome c oxidase subunit I+III
MEVLGVDIVTGDLEQVVSLPRQTYLPFFGALVTGVFFLSLLFKLYWLSPLALAATILLFLGWTQDTAQAEDIAALPVGHDRELPPHMQVERPPSWWAMAFSIVADLTAYTALLFGGLFLWVSAPNWPPAELPVPSLAALPVVALALTVATWTSRRAICADQRAVLNLWLATAGQGIATAGFIWLAMAVQPAAHTHAAAATMVVISLYAALRSAIGAIFAVYGIWRIRQGFVSRRRNLDLRLGGMWNSYTCLAGIVALLFPLVLAGLTGEGAP